MKKLLTVLLTALILLSLCACSSNSQADSSIDPSSSMIPDGDSISDATIEDNSNTADSKTDINENTDNGNSGNTVTDSSIQVQDPVLNAWTVMLMDNNDMWFLMEVDNPNDVDIAFTVDVDYMDGNTVAGSDSFNYYALDGGSRCLIYSNWGVPGCSSINYKFSNVRADGVKAVKGTYEETGRDENGVTLKFYPESDFSSFNAVVLFKYQDEIRAVSTYGFADMKYSENYFNASTKFDDYVLYVNCY